MYVRIVDAQGERAIEVGQRFVRSPGPQQCCSPEKPRLPQIGTQPEALPKGHDGLGILTLLGKQTSQRTPGTRMARIELQSALQMLGRRVRTSATRAYQGTQMQGLEMIWALL